MVSEVGAVLLMVPTGALGMLLDAPLCCTGGCHGNTHADASTGENNAGGNGSDEALFEDVHGKLFLDRMTMVL